jgi:glycosyltransferase involved in cell wall biosynthesis
MSEHEGFCLPLIESSFFNVPVVAFNAGAVSETLKGSGLIFNEKKTELVAGLLENIINDNELRLKINKKQEKLIELYLNEAQPEKIFSLLQSL